MTQTADIKTWANALIRQLITHDGKEAAAKTLSDSCFGAVYTAGTVNCGNSVISPILSDAIRGCLYNKILTVIERDDGNTDIYKAVLNACGQVASDCYDYHNVYSI